MFTCKGYAKDSPGGRPHDLRRLLNLLIFSFLRPLAAKAEKHRLLLPAPGSAIFILFSPSPTGSGQRPLPVGLCFLSL